jgi:hypothetical protein
MADKKTKAEQEAEDKARTAKAAREADDKERAAKAAAAKDDGGKAPSGKAGEVEGAKAGDVGKTEAPDPVHPVEGVPAENQPAGPDQHPGDRPIEDQGLGNPNDAQRNAGRRDPEALNAGGSTGAPDDPVYASATMDDTDGARIAKENEDPILLLEAASAAAGMGRYARNSSLQAVIRAYRVAQREIKEIQGRLDKRIEDREGRQAERRSERDAAKREIA